jgi:hypothetical protein
MSWPRAGRFAERSRTIGTIAQDGDRRRWRRVQPTQHTAQLSCLRIRLRRHGAEHILLSLVVADLGKQDLERASLVLTSRPHVAGVNRECRLGPGPGDGLLFQPGANTKGSLPGCFHARQVAKRQEVRQQRPRAAIRQQGAHLRDDPLVHWHASVGHDLGDRAKRPATGHRAPAWGEARRADFHRAEQRHQSARAQILSGRCMPHRWQRRRRRQWSSVCASTRWRCSAASICLPSANASPINRGVYSATAARPLTS